MVEDNAKPIKERVGIGGQLHYAIIRKDGIFLSQGYPLLDTEL